MSNATAFQLPNSLNLPPHLSAYKYFMVCSLTVAAWDTLVLSPRTWRLLRTPGWPALKILFNFLRVFMPVEFVVVAVAFFSTTYSRGTCDKIYLFEPICTAILLAGTSAIHVIRIHAIYERNRSILALMSLLYAIQIVVTSISCAFFRSVPLLEGQGCISGPKYDWVGIYWVGPTLLYTVSFGLALARSFDSLQTRKLSPWKLMLRDGLNLYGSIWLVNMANVCFWFIVKPTGADDPVKTIITSMAAILTTSMSLRIILCVRGSLDYGGTFGLSMGSTGTSSRTTHVISGSRSAHHPTNISTHNPHTYTLDDLRSKQEGDWATTDVDGKSSMPDDDPIKGGFISSTDDNNGVKITIDQEINYDEHPGYAK